MGFGDTAHTAQWARSAAAGLSFRWYRDDDFQFLLQLYRSTREDELARTGWTKDQKTMFVTMQFMAQHGHYQEHYADMDWLVIMRGRIRVGRLYLARWAREHRIVDISLVPRQRSRGFGTALLQDLQDEAATAGKALTIHVEKENPALGLYRRLGFAPVEDKGVYTLMRWRVEVS